MQYFPACFTQASYFTDSGTRNIGLTRGHPTVTDFLESAWPGHSHQVSWLHCSLLSGPSLFRQVHGGPACQAVWRSGGTGKPEWQRETTNCTVGKQMVAHGGRRGPQAKGAWMTWGGCPQSAWGPWCWHGSREQREGHPLTTTLDPGGLHQGLEEANPEQQQAGGELRCTLAEQGGVLLGSGSPGWLCGHRAS